MFAWGGWGGGEVGGWGDPGVRKNTPGTPTREYDVFVAWCIGLEKIAADTLQQARTSVLLTHSCRFCPERMTLSASQVSALKDALTKGLAKMSKQQMGAWALTNPGPTKVCAGGTNGLVGATSRDVTEKHPNSRVATYDAELSMSLSHQKYFTLLVDSDEYPNWVSPRARDGSNGDPELSDPHGRHPTSETLINVPYNSSEEYRQRYTCPRLLS